MTPTKRSERAPVGCDRSKVEPTRLRENMVQLNTINLYITCPLCNGYFVEATTVIDCLHTFCKSCLLKHFEDNNDCPKCHYQIHQSHPSHYVSFDRTMQDIVYKLVPGMQAEEQRRREQFNKRQLAKEARENSELAESSDSVLSNSELASSDDNQNSADCPENTVHFASNCCNADQDPITTHRRRDDAVLIQLLPDEQLEAISRSFIRLSAFATVNTVKRLLAYLLLRDITKYGEFDLFCNSELMGRDFSMAFIRKTRWRNKPEPLVLTYKERLEF